MWVEGVTVGFPGKKNEESASSRLTPRECRERGLTYQGALLVDLCYKVRDTTGPHATYRTLDVVQEVQVFFLD